MRALKCGENPFNFGKLLESGKRFVVGSVGVFNTANILEVGVFRSNSGIVEPRTYRVSEFDLAVVVGKEPRF